MFFSRGGEGEGVGEFYSIAAYMTLNITFLPVENQLCKDSTELCSNSDQIRLLYKCIDYTRNLPNVCNY